MMRALDPVGKDVSDPHLSVRVERISSHQHSATNRQFRGYVLDEWWRTSWARP
jgi:hypothetical protein